MKKLCIIVGLALLVCLPGCGYKDKTYEVPQAVLDSNEIVDYVYDTYGISAEQYVPVHISAVLGADHRGEWRIQFAERDSARPDSIFAAVDTATHKSYDYHTASYDTKLAQAYPLEDVISSEQAIALAEQVLSETYDVVYSRIEISTVNDTENSAPLWLVDFNDAFFVRLNAQTGEILMTEK